MPALVGTLRMLCESVDTPYYRRAEDLSHYCGAHNHGGIYPGGTSTLLTDLRVGSCRTCVKSSGHLYEATCFFHAGCCCGTSCACSSARSAVVDCTLRTTLQRGKRRAKLLEPPLHALKRVLDVHCDVESIITWVYGLKAIQGCWNGSTTTNGAYTAATYTDK